MSLVHVDIVGTHQEVEDLSAAVVLGQPSGATAVMLQAHAQNVRYTLDGTAPTATLGFQLKSTDETRLIGIGDGVTITVIEEAGGGKLEAQWFNYDDSHVSIESNYQTGTNQFRRYGGYTGLVGGSGVSV